MASWNDDDLRPNGRQTVGEPASDVIWRIVALALLAWWGVLAILVTGTGRLLWHLIFGG